MALNLKRLRELITYSPPGSYEGPDSGSGEGSYPASLEGPGQGSGEGSLGPMVSRKPPVHQGFGRRLLAALPDILSSGVTAAATPNVAGGGAPDIFRGMAAANQAREQRQIHNLSLHHAQNEEARKEADTRSQIASRAALAGFHNSTSELQKAQLADKAKNEEMQRAQAELQRQTALGTAQAHEITDETSNQPIPEIQPTESTIDSGKPQFEKPRVGIGPESPIVPNEPPTLKAGLPGNLPGGPPMMASARLPKELAQPAGHYTFNDPTRKDTRLAVPYVKQEAEMPIDAETAAALGLPVGTTSISKKGLGPLITGKLKEPKTDPNSVLDTEVRTELASMPGVDPTNPRAKDVQAAIAAVQQRKKDLKPTAVEPGTWSLQEGADGKPVLLNSKTGETKAAPDGVQRSGTAAKDKAARTKAEEGPRTALEYANSYLGNGVFTGAGDEALQEKFFELAKPTTGFRMTKAQMDMLQNSRSWMQGAEAHFRHATTGTWFSDEQRKQITETMKDLAASKLKAIQQIGGSPQGSGVVKTWNPTTKRFE